LRHIRIDFNVDDTVASLQALLVRLFGSGVEPRIEETLHLDLSLCGFLGPIAVTTLCGLRHWGENAGFPVTLSAPRHSVLRAYCEYSGLLNEFEQGPLPGAIEQITTSLVRHFETPPIQGLQEIVELVRQDVNLARGDENNLKLALSELTQNVIDHAGSKIGGFMSARAYKNVREVRLAVADFGVGVRQSLSRTTVVRSDIEAIRQALAAEVSGKSLTRNMGMGLTLLREIVERNGGDLLLASKRGIMVQRNKARFDTLKTAFPGTLAFVRLRILGTELSSHDEDEDVWA
jgi:anti-sigma regulatory factor (Ser/Thr protein kinase)